LASQETRLVWSFTTTIRRPSTETVGGLLVECRIDSSACGGENVGSQATPTRRTAAPTPAGRTRRPTGLPRCRVQASPATPPAATLHTACTVAVIPNGIVSFSADVSMTITRGARYRQPEFRDNEVQDAGHGIRSRISWSPNCNFTRRVSMATTCAPSSSSPTRTM